MTQVGTGTDRIAVSGWAPTGSTKPLTWDVRKRHRISFIGHLAHGPSWALPHDYGGICQWRSEVGWEVSAEETYTCPGQPLVSAGIIIREPWLTRQGAWVHSVVERLHRIRVVVIFYLNLASSLRHGGRQAFGTESAVGSRMIA